jgi:hypothetical protein
MAKIILIANFVIATGNPPVIARFRGPRCSIYKVYHVFYLEFWLPGMVSDDLALGCKCSFVYIEMRH